ncbi:hypothetical protein [Pedobacter duraquae]|uniref:HEAT repeat protein n=1 Tax=Pedobacter duraquae TaxID=425511 RepID=A0A4R6IPP8_9SPHI|nr:hypothetical protein [Pedobacter duraquae]TDO24270.1 hypothetical protein CLV32_0559 [Pedobacter duraquae]
MNDPIKDFVEKNRAEFDHLEAPVLKLDQLKPRFQAAPEVRKKSFLITNGSKWLVAASVLVTVTCLWLFFFNDTAVKPASQLAQQPVKEATKQNDTTGTTKTPDVVATTETVPVAFASNRKAGPRKPNTSAATQDLYAGLQDSTSASTRLMAILEMEKTGRVDNRVMDMLALTLNNDGNTNVRLAALSLMQKYSDDGHVSALLVSSLNKQNDPIVQLGLVSLLGKKKNLKIDDKLKSLADGPDTFAAVRDEAYSILLNQNKL